MFNGLKETLELLNPWWKNAEISKELAKDYKRNVFFQAEKLLNYKQAAIISGLRRVGKSTVLYQLIEKLIKKENPLKIVYFSFDKEVDDVSKVFEAYNSLTKIDYRNEKIFVFLDEVTKLNKWASQIKLFYDSMPNIKFFLSSSSSINLEEEAIKNLGGRYFIVNVFPFSFREFLELKGKHSFLSKEELYEKEIKNELESYLLRPFPETIFWQDELLVKDYLRTTIIDKIVKSDLSDRFKDVNKELLFALLSIFYSEPGIYLNYDSLAKNMKVSKKTLVQHIFYLESAYLIRRVRNFRPGIFATSRKLQRIYPYWWTFAYCYGKNEDKIFENIVASILNAGFYWRELGKEIDFLKIDDKKMIPIEVKNKINIQERELNNIIYFLRKFRLKESIVIYHGEEKEININGAKIFLIPLWKWLLR